MVLAEQEGALHLKFDQTRHPLLGARSRTRRYTRRTRKYTSRVPTCTQRATPEGMTCPLAHQVRKHLFPSSAVSLEKQIGCGPGGPKDLSDTLPRSQRNVRPATTLSSHDVGWTPYGAHHCTVARLVCSESPQVGDKVKGSASAAPQSSLSACPSAAVAPSTGTPRPLLIDSRRTQHLIVASAGASLRSV
jgi:hypothetical protein